MLVGGTRWIGFVRSKYIIYLSFSSRCNDEEEKRICRFMNVPTFLWQYHTLSMLLFLSVFSLVQCFSPPSSLLPFYLLACTDSASYWIVAVGVAVLSTSCVCTGHFVSLSSSRESSLTPSAQMFHSLWDSGRVCHSNNEKKSVNQLAGFTNIYQAYCYKNWEVSKCASLTLLIFTAID